MPTIRDLVPETERRSGYWVDLSAIQFEDTAPNASWMQAFPVGEYSHPLYGKIKMTVDRAKNMARNVIQKVRGIDIAIDFAHDSGGEAAGWVKSAEARHDGLWLFVEWTKEAADSIRTGKWRYFSPEFVDVWKHEQTGEKFKDVLVGGGLTNRPFLKNILPVNLSEVLGEEYPSQKKEGGAQVEELLKALRASLKLAEDASQEDVLKALDVALKEETKEEHETVGLTESQVTKLLEDNPALQVIVDQNKNLNETNKALLGRVVNLEATAKQSGVEQKLDDWHSGGTEGKTGLPVALDEKIASFMLSLDEAKIAEFTTILDEVVKTGLVPLGERARTQPKKKKDSKTLEDHTEEGIKKLMDETEGLSYADAASQYFLENEDLYEEYLEALEPSDSGKGDA